MLRKLAERYQAPLGNHIILIYPEWQAFLSLTFVQGILHNGRAVYPFTPQPKGARFAPDDLVDALKAHSSTTMTINLETHNNCPFILGKIDNIPASFLCDTGAAITAISLAFYKQVPSLTKHPPDTLAVQSIKTVNGKIVPVQGLALIPFQIGESIYPFYAYIVKNLAYDVILGADFLTYNNSTISFDSNTIELPPPTDTPPPCPTYAFSCSVHASLTCILPPFSESILPAVLNDSLLTPTTSSRVGLVESNSSLAER